MDSFDRQRFGPPFLIRRHEYIPGPACRIFAFLHRLPALKQAMDNRPGWRAKAEALEYWILTALVCGAFAAGIWGLISS